MPLLHDDSGLLTISGDMISYASATHSPWCVPCDTIRLLGEVTADHGPFVDDWFLVFVVNRRRLLFASAHAAGVRDVLRDLGAFLGAELHRTLYSSPDYASCILWPHELLGKPLFRFWSPKRRGPVAWIASLLGLRTIRHELTANVLKWLEAYTDS